MMKFVVCHIPALVTLLASVTACTSRTSFEGSPHVVDGRSGCEKKCSSLGMELTGMVVMGEYGDGCICGVPGTTQDPGATVGAAEAAAKAIVAQQKQERPPQLKDQPRFSPEKPKENVEEDTPFMSFGAGAKPNRPVQLQQEKAKSESK